MNNQQILDINTPKSIECKVSGAFESWMAQSGGSLAVSTYQAGKVALIGWDGQQVSLMLRQFSKPMGMAVQGQRLALATQHEVLLFANSPLLAAEYIQDQPGRYDTLYLPRVAYYTGDLNIHDMAFGSDRLWMVNSRFSCLATTSKDFSFAPCWQPEFISELVPEDRCHLNGLALKNGQPKYVTALGESNQVGGWRDTKATGGILIDVETKKIILRGMSMPHSPRWHDGYLWVLNSGAGELWRVEPETGKYEVVCLLPGFLRGLCCINSYAVIGLSQIREQHIFGGLPLQERFERLVCGIAVVDLRDGKLVGTFEFTAGCQELYDVQFLPGVKRPTILNQERLEVRQAVTAPEFAYWLRPSSQVQ